MEPIYWVVLHKPNGYSHKFDDIFFTDLPDNLARYEILELQLKRIKRDHKSFDLKHLSQLTKGFSGAELEHCVGEALFHAFHQNRELTLADLQASAQSLVPLSVTASEELETLRTWAKGRTRSADTKEE